MDTGCLHQSEPVEFDIFGQVRGDLMPNGRDKVLDGTHLPTHEIDIQVQVPVVQLLDHMQVHQGTQLLCIEDEAGIGVRDAFHGDMQLEVVAVPMLIGTLAEHLLVPLPCPGGIVQLVCGIEMFNPGKIDHAVVFPGLLTGPRNYESGGNISPCIPQ